jgi:L-ascorbate metabolism protein UlaG (beta-lactamase superfamily)
MAVYERLFPRFRPKRELRPSGDGRGAALRISWLGTAGFVVSTETTTVLLDPFVSRQGLAGLRLVRRLVPDELAIARHIPLKVDAVLCGHSHYDHIADAPRIAHLRGAKLVGSESTCAWGHAEGLAEDQLIPLGPLGGTTRIGDIEVRFVPSRHGRAILGRVPLPGEVRVAPHGPQRLWHYRMGGAFGILLRTPGGTVYHNGSADLVDAELEGERADVLLACLAGRAHTENYVGRLVSALAPSLVVPSHHDAFFAPLERGLHLLPGIDLDGFVSEAARRAPKATILTPDYGEAICVPAGDARGSVIATR